MQEGDVDLRGQHLAKPDPLWIDERRSEYPRARKSSRFVPGMRSAVIGGSAGCRSRPPRQGPNSLEIWRIILLTAVGIDCVLYPEST